MHLKKLPFLLAVLLACGFVVKAQQSRCLVKLSELPSIPELRGFRLGMTMDQVTARLPKSAIRPADEFGFTTLNIFPDYLAGIDKSTFESVRTISIEFLDGGVTSLWIGYDQSFKWQSVDEFTAGMSTALKLTNSWRTRFRTRVLDCADFSVAVIPVGQSPSIKFVDEAAREVLEKRKAAKEAAEPQR